MCRWIPEHLKTLKCHKGGKWGLWLCNVSCDRIIHLLLHSITMTVSAHLPSDWRLQWLAVPFDSTHPHKDDSVHKRRLIYLRYCCSSVTIWRRTCTGITCKWAWVGLTCRLDEMNRRQCISLFRLSFIVIQSMVHDRTTYSYQGVMQRR